LYWLALWYCKEISFCLRCAASKGIFYLAVAVATVVVSVVVATVEVAVIGRAVLVQV
jgi:hypothetical protein